jgi:hypothetical protein
MDSWGRLKLRVIPAAADSSTVENVLRREGVKRRRSARCIIVQECFEKYCIGDMVEDVEMIAVLTVGWLLAVRSYSIVAIARVAMYDVAAS